MQHIVSMSKEYSIPSMFIPVSVLFTIDPIRMPIVDSSPRLKSPSLSEYTIPSVPIIISKAFVASWTSVFFLSISEIFLPSSVSDGNPSALSNSYSDSWSRWCSKFAANLRELDLIPTTSVRRISIRSCLRLTLLARMKPCEVSLEPL